MKSRHRVRRRWERWRSLSASDRHLLARTAARMAVVRAAVWVLPARSLLKRMRRHAACAIVGTPLTDSRPTRERIGWAIEAASRRIPRATCLVRSITAHAILASHGYDSEICVGVCRGNGNEFNAHAWVESGGVPLLSEPSLSRFARFTDLPRALVWLSHPRPRETPRDTVTATLQRTR